MKAVIIVPNRAKWAIPVERGLRRHGIQVELSETVKPCDFFVTWNVARDNCREALKTGPTLVHELGYLGNRRVWKSFGWNGLNGHAEHCTEGVPDDRWQTWKHLLKPWKSDGYDLIIGQTVGDASLKGLDPYEWAEGIAKQLDNPYFRPHPLCKERRGIEHAQTLLGTLQEAFSGAGRVITYNSNTAVESVLEGIPTITFDEGSMAWGVTSHALDEPLYMGDREGWGSRLAYTQWHLDEIARGDFWEVLCRYFS